jgi:hypothetical protein
MGLLDDAIRDHFELKRRHGADPGEVERMEHEALGPPRREPLEPAVGASSAFDAEHHGAVSAEAPAPPPPVEDDDDEEESEPPPSTPAGEPEAPVAPPADQSTSQFAVDDLDTDEHPAREDGVAGEREHDELEETPDFLQETPEHERLWFEQKPPRDFDF